MLFDSLDRVWFAASPIIGILDTAGTLVLDSLPRMHAYYKKVNGSYLCGARFITARTEPTGLHINGKSYLTPLANIFSRINFAQEWRGKIYLTVHNSIYRLDENGLQRVLHGDHRVIFMYKDPDDLLWVGYADAGLERFDNVDLAQPWTIPPLKRKSVSNILKDRDGGLWVTTLESGVFHIPDLLIRHYAYKDSSKVHAVFASGDKVVVSGYNGVVTAWDMQTRQTSLITKREGAIRAFHRDRKGRMWMSTDALLITDDRFRTVKVTQGVNSFIDFAEAPNGNVWGCSPREIIKLSPEGDILDFRRSLAYFRNMLLKDNLLFVATRIGMHVYDTLINLVEQPATLSKYKISKMLTLNDSTVVMGTIGNGFLVVNQRDWSVRQFDTRNGFVADNIYAAEERDTAIWLATEKGIFVTPAGLLAIGQPQFSHLAKANGLIADKVNFMAFTQKDVWAFTDEGIATIPYASTNKIKRSADFYMKKILVNNQAVEPRGPLVLDHHATDIKLSFGFLSLSNPNVVCRYRLSSSDPWIYTDQRSIQFSSLAPGKYQPELQHSLDNFHWTPEKSFQAIIIHPPWWQRWYSQLGGFLVLSGLVYLYFRTFYNIRQRHEYKLIQAEMETLERERKRIAQELHDGVAGNLSAIKLTVQHVLRKHAEPMADDLDEQFLFTIKDIRSIVYELTPPGLERDGLFAAVRKYVETLTAALPIQVDVSSTGNDLQNARLRIVAFRVLQELLNNAIKHSGATKIQIQLASMSGRFEISFSDNGKGFEPDARANGFGLLNVESRVRSIHGTIQRESGPGGTRYEIRFPVK